MLLGHSLCRPLSISLSLSQPQENSDEYPSQTRNTDTIYSHVSLPPVVSARTRTLN